MSSEGYDVDEEGEEEEMEREFEDGQEEAGFELFQDLQGADKAMINFFKVIEMFEEPVSENKFKSMMGELKDHLSNLPKTSLGGKFLVLGNPPTSPHDQDAQRMSMKRKNLSCHVIDLDERQLVCFDPLTFLPKFSINQRDLDKASKDLFEVQYNLISRDEKHLQLMGSDHLYQIERIPLIATTELLVKELNPSPAYFSWAEKE